MYSILRQKVKNRTITTMEITILGIKRGKIVPIVTEIAFMIFMAIVAKNHSKSLVILLARSITMMKVLSPISARKTSKKL